MILGILKEPTGENRVALLPESVAAIIKKKVTVRVEKGAGASSFTSDEEYKSIGAEIVSRDEIFKSDVVVSIAPPEVSEFVDSPSEKVLISVFNPLGNPAILKPYQEKGITLFSMDMIPRTTRAQAMDILSSMATISGYKAVLHAASILPRFFPMFMSAAGTIKPAKVLILGAGVAGLQAIATSRKLGAVVEVFDVRSAVKEEVMSLGGKFIEVEGATEDKAAGGYAVEQTEEFKKKQAEMIQTHAKAADVIICTAQIPGKKAPVLITKDSVENMKPGSVIIDLAASTGGNCEATKNGETIELNGVKIVGNSYFPSEMPMDASRMYGKNVVNFATLLIGEEGNLVLDFEDEIVKGTCMVHKGEIVNERVNQLLK